MNKELSLLLSSPYIGCNSILKFNDKFIIELYSEVCVDLVWRSGSVMDCHATAGGSIPSGNGVKIELHVLCKGL